MKTLLICTLIFCGLVLAEQERNFLNDESNLVMLDSISAVPISTFLQYPDLYDFFGAATEGCLAAQTVKSGNKTFAFTGYEGFYPPYPNVDPNGVLYDVSNGKLVEVGRLDKKVNQSIINSFASKHPDMKYIVYSANVPLFSFPGVSPAFVPQIITLGIHKFDSNGVIDQVPNLLLDISSLSPDVYNATAGYYGLGGISEDGNYILVTYATTLFPNTPGVITGQKYALLKVSLVNDTYQVEVKVTIDTLPTGVPRLFSYSQNMFMWKDEPTDTKYHIVIGENTWNLTSPYGLTSHISHYTYDEQSNIFALDSTLQTPQYITGFGVDFKKGFVYTTSFRSDIDNSSAIFSQVYRYAFQNDAPDPEYNLRGYYFDSNGQLEYVGGIETHMDMFQVRVAPNSKRLLVTGTPISVLDIYPTVSNPLSPRAYRYATGVGVVYSIDKQSERNINLSLLSVGDAPPLPFCAEWIDDDTFIVGGQPTYRSYNSSFLGTPIVEAVGAKNIQLYKLGA